MTGEDTINEYTALTRAWPLGHLVEGELKARTWKAVLVDKTWYPLSQVEGYEFKGDRAKLIISDWIYWKRRLGEQ